MCLHIFVFLVRMCLHILTFFYSEKMSTSECFTLASGHVFAFGESRALAIANMVLGLKEIQIRGEIHTNVDYTIDLLHVCLVQAFFFQLYFYACSFSLKAMMFCRL